MFEKIKTKPLKYKARGLPKTATISNPLPALTSGTQNQGLSCFVPKENADVLKNVISIASNGAAGTTYYQRNEFTILQDAYAIKWKNKGDKLLDKHYLFFASAISKQTVDSNKYGWDYKANWTKVENETIQLPITSSGEIDFAFMENFIAELQAARLAELQAYLLATGLNDYELTQKERQVLEMSNITWGEFKLGELFEISSYKKRFDANKTFISEIGHPYVVRTSLNNGVRGYINEDDVFLNEANTIAFGQDTATMFYQEKPYFTGDKIKILKSKDNQFKHLNAMFFISAMKKSFSSFGWGSSSFNVEIIASQLLTLPITSSGEIDFSFMETFIRAIQKLVIKDLVLYAEREMKATKSVMSRKKNENT